MHRAIVDFYVGVPSFYLPTSMRLYTILDDRLDTMLPPEHARSARSVRSFLHGAESKNGVSYQRVLDAYNACTKDYAFKFAASKTRRKLA